MLPPESTPVSYGQARPRRADVSFGEVKNVAVQQLLAGQRPTVASVREKVGGSPATINELLGQVWTEIGKDLAGETAVATRLPAHVARAAEELWFVALDESNKRSVSRRGVKQESLDQREQRVQMREHVIGLREKEFEDQLTQRDQLLAQQALHMKEIFAISAKDRAAAEASDKRCARLEAALAAADNRASEMLEAYGKAVSANKRRAVRQLLPRARRSVPTGALRRKTMKRKRRVR